MCGIGVVVAAGADAVALQAELAPLLSRRGPDVAGELVTTQGLREVRAFGHVLHLRGNAPQEQPVAAGDDWLLWNGEVYSGIDVPPGTNDGAALLASLVARPAAALRTISAVEGEWAMVYYCAKERRLLFGRDFLGRRSLLWRRSLPNLLALASVAPANASAGEWQEVPAGGGLFFVNIDGPLLLTEIPWRPHNATLLDRSEWALVAPIGRMNTTELIPSPPELRDAAALLQAALAAAVERRIATSPPPKEAGAARVALLFSGGLDSAVLSALADESVPVGEPIDLINVAFERAGAAEAAGFDTPDRRTALATLAELRRTRPSRRWRLILVDVPRAELAQHADHIRALAAPRDTVLDYDISAALWFAARGAGFDADDHAPALSSTPVLLLGMGADEQLGGYSRARARFNSGGWAALVAELQMDLDRIASRNVGRDDRVVGDHGKEGRFPFLDERVVRLLNSFPAAVKTDPRLGRERGDKQLLRCVAKNLGLYDAAVLPKRAIQFGSRIADSSQRGSDRSAAI